MINLLQELENLMRQEGRSIKAGDHCSDFFARDRQETIWHGHNEDWSIDVKPFVYVVIYFATNTANFVPIAGFVYPGMIPGSALTFNNHGIVYTQNAMFPSHSRNYG